MTKRTGRCMCGNVTYTATLTNQNIGTCYCKMCQRWSAGAFMGVHTQSFELTSAPETVTEFKSSDWASRGFCATCGSNIYYHAPQFGGPSVALGSLDDTSGLDVNVQLFIEKKPGGFALANDTKLMTEAEIEAKYGALSSVSYTHLTLPTIYSV